MIYLFIILDRLRGALYLQMANINIMLGVFSIEGAGNIPPRPNNNIIETSIASNKSPNIIEIL